MIISLIRTSRFYFIISFLALIAAGTCGMRYLPVMKANGAMSLIDALFMSTSAVCVTGLTTVPLPAMNGLGQLWILLLIQVGGLGFMTISASIILWMGKRMSVTGSLMMGNLSDTGGEMRRTDDLLRAATGYTLAVESVGAALLFPCFAVDGYALGEAAYLAVFHSISAFCNAGFSPLPESLIGVSWCVKLVIAALIILGGIGIYVVLDFAEYRRTRGKLGVGTKLALTVTAVLIVAGMLGLRLFENASEHSISWMDAFFQSVTARTAGFNSVAVGSLSSSSLVLLIVLMLIGASPGSTGGGIKTTAVGLAFCSLVNTFSGNRHVLLFGREVPTPTVLKAFTITVSFILLASAGAVILANASPGISMQTSFFNIASALGTVGLSLDDPGRFGDWGKWVLIGYMFLGRIGPFTMFVFLLGREKSSCLRYPEERMVIG